MAGLQLNSPHFRVLSARALFGRGLKLFGLYVLMAAIGHALEDLLQFAALMPTDGQGDPQIAGIVLVSLVTLAWTLFSSALTLTVNARMFFVQSSSSLKIFRCVELVSIESLRQVSATLIRLPLLLAPALFEWVRLAPTSFIVLFDPAYEKGEIDALQAARFFFRRHWARVLFFLGLQFFILILEITTTDSPSDALALWQAPIQHAGSILVFSLLRLVTETLTLFGYASQFPSRLPLVDRQPSINVS